VDRASLIAAIERWVEGADRPVVARFTNTAPRIGDAAARRAALEARVAVSASVRVAYAGSSVGSLGPQRLAKLLRFVPSGHRYRTTFDAERLARAVQPLVQPWRRRARNARFVIDGETVAVAPSQTGWDVDPDALRDAVTAAALGPGIRFANAPFRAVPPEITTEKANALGIRRRLVSFTTEMGASSSNRIHNVHLMADFIDGTMLKPGEVFSYNRIVGPRTPERGFLEGQMIV